MVAKKRGLGRGLDALLNIPSDGRQAAGAAPSRLMELDVDLLRRGAFQPRRRFDEEGLQELADSIREQGLVQPILVRLVGLVGTEPGSEQQYEIIAGERRWRAAQIAGQSRVPVIIYEADDQTAGLMALVENMQREDLNALEEAEGLARLVNEFNMSHEAAAQAVGCSRPAVSNLLRLLELEQQTKNLLLEGKLEMGHARALLALSGQKQVQTAAQVAQRGLTVRQTEQLVKSLLAQAEGGNQGRQEQDANILKLQDDLGTRLGAPVVIQGRASGSGTIRIRYHSLDELDGILQKFR